MADAVVDLEEKIADDIDGSSLRKKYEAAIGELKTLRPENAKFKARDVIDTKGFTLVKPEDLEGVAPDKVEEHAQKLQEERKTQQTDLARDIFAKQGYEGDELDSVVEEFMAGKVPEREPDDAAARRFEGVRALDREPSTPVSAQSTEQLHGADAIKHGLANKPRRARP